VLVNGEDVIGWLFPIPEVWNDTELL